MIELISLPACALVISAITVAVVLRLALVMLQVELQAARPHGPGSGLIFPKVNLGLMAANGLNELVALWTEVFFRIARTGVLARAVKSGLLARRVLSSESPAHLLEGGYGTT